LLLMLSKQAVMGLRSSRMDRLPLTIPLVILIRSKPTLTQKETGSSDG
jgi:hypothetical protein